MKIDLNFRREVELRNGIYVMLRYHQVGDVESMLKFVNKLAHEETYVSLNKEYTYDEELDWVVGNIKKMRAGKEIHIGAYDKGKYIGSVDIFDKQEENQSHVCGFGIAVDKEFREFGLGRILMEEAFIQAKSFLEKKLVSFTCFADNERAINLYKSMGCVEFGRLPKAIKYQGRFTDQLLFYKTL